MTAPIRVLLIRLKWPPETFMWRLVDGLARRGMHMTLAVHQRPGADWPATPNVDYVWTPPWGESGGRSLWQTARALGGAARRSPAEARRLMGEARRSVTPSGAAANLHRYLPLAGRRWDVVYFPWNTMAITYHPLLERGPSVISCRGTQINITPHNPERASIVEGLATTFGRASAVHCVSAHIRDEATQYGLDAAKAVVIHPAVDTDTFRPSARPAGDGPFRVVTTGGLLWGKGYEYALLAVRALVDRGLDVRFEIIGGGEERQRLLFTIDDLGLRQHVVLHGPLPPAGVLARLQAADAFLLTSLSEGLSNAALEAMACGLPVVTTAVGGMPEAVTDGVEGYLVPARDPAAAAEALWRLAKAPQLRREMGAAGRRRVVQAFALERQIDAYADLFRRVA